MLQLNVNAISETLAHFDVHDKATDTYIFRMDGISDKLITPGDGFSVDLGNREAGDIVMYSVQQQHFGHDNILLLGSFVCDGTSYVHQEQLYF